MARRNKNPRPSSLRTSGPKRSGRTGRLKSPVKIKRGAKGRIKSQSKVVDGIQFKSMLEVFTYRKLKEHDLNFEYEGTSFTIMEGFHYPEVSWENRTNGAFEDKSKSSVRGITYTPDFIGYDDNRNMTWVIECKGFANDRFPNTWKMFKALLVKTNNCVPLYLPKNQKQVLEVISMIIELK
ncbi:MAG: DUF1064 domain-containing protein [Proteobacteria bacterium]|jgi:hypothetical protein|nr:DUF1064 domain-containing protein [Pseudomonadota bacterium]